MKKILVIIFANIFLLSASPQALTYWMWKLNQAKIASTLCVKKDVKENTCKGKCFFKKKIENEENRQVPSLPVELKFQNFPLYCSTVIFLKPHRLKIIPKIISDRSSFIKNRLITNKLLRPPQQNFIS